MAINWEKLKARYEAVSPVVQIDSLAMNLVRLQTLAEGGTEESVAQHLIRESQFFIEWTVPGLSLEIDMALVQELLSLQRLLSRWKLNWSELWNNPTKRQKMAETAQHWYEQLQSSGAIASEVRLNMST
ncbi:hypothetical protein [cf. Phormidesmis sp. LEGE 11477]|uniref:hypothetical protein n=1 Tax=cf. Phormidesmis sp. LEGE 11477 TaxID=1828680 RepID=UPI001881D9AC|nr:hypothetical protein [cf. Phormidesmis sp. LEGE 11477]MBE9060222.1 hypothetical protein [cf. Phormidesmis sp. LEGE 11477]